jgi:integrase
MLFQRMGMQGKITGHGFRSTFSTWVSEKTHHSAEVREMALAHTISNKVEEAYRRGDMLAKRHKLMRDWERYCNGRRPSAAAMD